MSYLQMHHFSQKKKKVVHLQIAIFLINYRGIINKQNQSRTLVEVNETTCTNKI